MDRLPDSSGLVVTEDEKGRKGDAALLTDLFSVLWIQASTETARLGLAARYTRLKILLLADPSRQNPKHSPHNLNNISNPHAQNPLTSQIS
jgi:hypothetical protein